MVNHVLVTGPNGFVGRALCRQLAETGLRVTGLVRRAGVCPPEASEWIVAGNDFADLERKWDPQLKPECVVHLAARVHVLRDSAPDAEAAFHATNVDLALRLARTAHARGVSRFVFVSSIKALGDNDHGHALREDDEPSAADAYGRSKWAAEKVLRALAAETGLDVVIVRPPLVYGPEVSANFLALLDAVWRRIPLPLGAVHARRSVVFVDNLAHALMQCCIEPAASGQCFHVADGHAPTVPELIQILGRALDRRALLLPVPPALLRLAGAITGRSQTVDRLVNDLRVDVGHIQTILGWQAPVSLEEGLTRTAHWYRQSHL